MKLTTFVFSALFLVVLTVAGCSEPQSGSVSNESNAAASGGKAATEDHHDHPSEGPHHGTLIELGKEEYHAELVHDASVVTIYILDSAASKAVPIDASEVTINLVHDGKPEQFSLPASADAGDPAGQSSRFVLENAELAGHLDEKSAAPRLNVSISGTAYRGTITHSHDAHSDHDHDH